jgi:UDP-N-acetylglucosamine/UDP-N-acetylgalactosamine 4-epimerase
MSRILITGGAGFIGSNLVDYFLSKGHYVVCLDNLETGFETNIQHNFTNPKFKFINGDIRNIEVCNEAVKGCDIVSHQAALGSVPRSIQNPANTNSVNIDGFLNMLIASRDAKVKRFVYAASSSTYGDSKKIPKVEEEIGKPLSPYAITKYVNELYADVFAKTYGMQCIGLRYFNVFGKRQTPNGAYAAVIPLWVKKLINHEQPIINGDGSYSRDFTYIDNVIHANEQALFEENNKIFAGQRNYYNLEFDTHKYLKQVNKEVETLLQNVNMDDYYFSEVFNIAYGGNTNLIDLFNALRNNLAKHDKQISEVEPIFGENRIGDVPHSQASILKAKTIINYNPQYDAAKGFELAAEWYFNNLSE